jgi:hypothetical protein
MMFFDCCLVSQLSKFPMLPPSGSAAGKQQACMGQGCRRSGVVNYYTNPNHKARLLAAAAPHSGDWLHTLPIASCGLHLDNDSFRIAVGKTWQRSMANSHLSVRRHRRRARIATRVVFRGMPT